MSKEDIPLLGNEIIIDTAFVKEYYSGDKNNDKLNKKIARQDNVVVVFPNPSELMKRFVKAQEKFVSIIAENEMVREMLESETMVNDHFTKGEGDAHQDSTDSREAA